jgi:short-subunit dehydrogenase involved in D-alanine esterification of teichoic acids
VNDNLSPNNNNLKEAIKKRKELYKLISDLSDKDLRKELRQKISEIKQKQNENIECWEELEEIEKKLK